MKKTFLLLITLMTAIISHAKMTVGEQIWWGYFSENDAANLPYEGHLGYGQSTTIDAAIFIPAHHPIAGSASINAIRLWLGNDISSVGDMTLWISKKLPSNISNADYTQSVPRSSLVSKLNEIQLTSPYSINNEGIYVGYSFRISGKAYPIMGGGKDVANGFYYRVTGNDWMDFYGEGYGNLAIQVLLSGVTLNDNEATPLDFGTSYVLKGGTVTVPVEIYNTGKEPISSISYTITTNGTESAEQSVNMDKIPFAATGTAYIPFSADAEAKKYSKILTISKVNGSANTSSKKTASGNLITISEKPAALPVVEEFTGTWCGYCPYGFVGMEKTHETYGDKVALIAVHKGDVMEIIDYSAIDSPSGYPGARINREYDLYPSADYLKYYLDYILENYVSIASIEATASWTGPEMTAIKLDTKTKFVYSDENGQYGLAFVLVEDGLKGSGSDWRQANYLSGGSGDSDMQFWFNSGSYVSGLEFNHVPVAAWNVKKGIDGSVNPNIVDGAVQDFSYEVNISNKKLIQDKSKLKVIAMLIDRTTGYIINAAQTTIGDASAIHHESAEEATVTSRYTIDGRAIKNPQKGLNIIRMSDGTTKKVLVK